MNRLLKVSLTLNGILLVIVGVDALAIKSFKKYRTQMTNWSNLVSEAVKAHYDNGGVLDIPPEMQTSMDAFTIFMDNDIV